MGKKSKSKKDKEKKKDGPSEEQLANRKIFKQAVEKYKKAKKEFIDEAVVKLKKKNKKATAKDVTAKMDDKLGDFVKKEFACKK